MKKTPTKKETEEEISLNVEELIEFFFEFIDSDITFTEEEVSEFIKELIPLRNRRRELFETLEKNHY